MTATSASRRQEPSRTTSPPTRPPWMVTAAAVLAVGLGLALLQAWLVFLWSSRSRVGLAMPFARLGQDDIPHLGAWIYFVPLGILSIAGLSRFAATRSRAFAGLAVDDTSFAGWGRSVALLCALYGGLGMVAAVVEHLVFHHFVTGPAHHVAIIVILLGVHEAGRRRPFLGVRLSPPSHPDAQRRQRIANWICIITALAVYASWMANEPLTNFAHRLDGLQTTLFILATLPPAALFGWAILHSSCAAAATRVVDALESRFERLATRQDRGRGWRAATVTGIAHFGVAALLLGLGFAFWRWAFQAWGPSGARPFLGVDWYFVSVWSAVTAAEAVILPATALLAGLGVHRALAWPSTVPPRG